MDYLPITIKIVSANILIVGGGKVATHKAQILARFTTHATVVAPEITEELKALPFHIKEKTFEAADLDGVQLLFACTGDHELNHRKSPKGTLPSTTSKWSSGSLVSSKPCTAMAAFW